MESDMNTTGFGYFLRDIRENGKISLRRLAQETQLDPAYLSRMERELSPAPRVEVVQRIAKALCDLQNLSMAECEKLKRDLLDSAGQLTDNADLIDDLKQRFAERLREQGMAESYIRDAVNKVSLEAMDRVLSGQEMLEIADTDSLSLGVSDERESKGEEVHFLEKKESPASKIMMGISDPDFIRYSSISDRKNSASDYIDENLKKFKTIRAPSSPSPRRRSRAVKKTKFRAGSRAFIEVDGDLTSYQEELLRSITNTVRSILKGK
jgi:transcriptional regulator with XRE-family HTH domain